MDNRDRAGWRRAAVAAGLAAAIAACGGGSDGGGGGSPIAPSGSGPGPSGATITLGANGAVTPSQVSIATGQSVTFVNNDSRSHEIASDPHPSHTRCPSINGLGTIAAGQTKLTNSFAGAGSCGFHDHNEPTNSSLQGTIVIQ